MRILQRGCHPDYRISILSRIIAILSLRTKYRYFTDSIPAVVVNREDRPIGDTADVQAIRANRSLRR